VVYTPSHGTDESQLQDLLEFLPYLGSALTAAGEAVNRIEERLRRVVKYRRSFTVGAALLVPAILCAAPTSPGASMAWTRTGLLDHSSRVMSVPSRLRRWKPAGHPTRLDCRMPVQRHVHAGAFMGVHVVDGDEVRVSAIDRTGVGRGPDAHVTGTATPMIRNCLSDRNRFATASGSPA
jgi:hypothetical protein